MAAIAVETDAAALAAYDAALEASRRRRLAPPPKRTVSEWAAERRMVAAGTSPMPGPWRNERAPYLVEIMDAFSDPRVERVVVMKPRRVGGTEAINNVLGYFADQDPSPQFMVQPTVELAEGWSKEHLSPMIAATPCLSAIMEDASSRKSGNTILQKLYPGGRITVVGANSGSGFRMRGARVACGDEVDAWPASAGAEGDPVDLMIGRTDAFYNRKIGLLSTPLLKGLSRIEAAFYEGDQRRYYVPCPACGAFSILAWDHLRYADDPANPVYACPACGACWPEAEKYNVVPRGEWRAHAPFTGTASFQFNALISLFDGARWPRLVEFWKAAQEDTTRLQVFVNQFLAETWEERGGLKADSLLARRERYDAEVPAGVLALTMGVDVQGDRLEYVVRGWGKEEESWLVAREVIVGDPALPATRPGSPWAELDARRTKEYRDAAGRAYRVLTTCVDSGYLATEAVYAYCKPRFAQRVYATKGASKPGSPMLPKRPTTNNRARVRLWLLGTDAAKDEIYGRLRLTVRGPRYWHLPEWADEDYVAQLTAEKPVQEQVNGRWVRRYKLPPNARNEVLDCEVGCLVAYRLTPTTLVKAPPTPTAPDPTPPVAEPTPAVAPLTPPNALPALRKARRGPHRGRWVDGWR